MTDIANVTAERRAEHSATKTKQNIKVKMAPKPEDREREQAVNEEEQIKWKRVIETTENPRNSRVRDLIRPEMQRIRQSVRPKLQIRRVQLDCDDGDGPKRRNFGKKTMEQ